MPDTCDCLQLITQGIRIEDSIQEAPHVQEVDVFQGTNVRFQSLAPLTGVRSATFVQCPSVTSLALPPGAGAAMQKLWVVQCKLLSMVGVSALRQLQVLVLDGNKLTHISGLGALPHLKRLWLNDNRIASLAGVAAAPQLEELSVARNRLVAVHEDIESCAQLTSVNVAGNRIGHFKELTPFKRLSALKELFLEDGHWGRNPVCGLSNFRTFAVHALPQVQVLDSLRISESARAHAEATVVKKAMFYNMRIKVLHRNTAGAIRRARVLLAKYCDRLAVASHPLWRQRHAALAMVSETWMAAHAAGVTDISDQHYEQHDAAASAVFAALLEFSKAHAGVEPPPLENGAIPPSEGSPTLQLPQAVQSTAAASPLGAVQGALSALAQARDDVGTAIQALPSGLPPPAAMQLAAKVAALDGVLALQSRQLRALRALFLSLQSRLVTLSLCHEQRLLLELRTGGNIRFEDGKPEDSWFKSCVNLLRSRFYKKDFAGLGVRGLRVHRVTRVYNRHLRTHFDARMAAVVKSHPQLAEQLQQTVGDAGKASRKGSKGGSKDDAAAASSDSKDSKSRRALEYLFYTPPWSGPGGATAAREDALAYCQRVAEEGFSAMQAEVEVPTLPLVADVNHAVTPPLTFAPRGKRFFRQKSATEVDHSRAAAAAYSVYAAAARTETPRELLRRGGASAAHPTPVAADLLTVSARAVPFSNSLTCCDYPRLVHAMATALAQGGGWAPSYPPGYTPPEEAPPQAASAGGALGSAQRASAPAGLCFNSSAAAAAVYPSVATPMSDQLYAEARKAGPFDLAVAPSSQHQPSDVHGVIAPDVVAGVLGGVDKWNTAAGVQTSRPATRVALKAAVSKRNDTESGDPAVLALLDDEAPRTRRAAAEGKEGEGGVRSSLSRGNIGIPVHDPRVCEGVMVVSKVFLGMCASPEYAAGAMGEYMRCAPAPRHARADPPSAGARRKGARWLAADDVVRANADADGRLAYDPADVSDDVQGGGEEGKGDEEAPPVQAAGGAPSPPMPLHSIMQARSDDPRQKQWAVLDPVLALPEYIIEYEYLWGAEGGGDAEEDTPSDSAAMAATVSHEMAVLAGAGGGADVSSPPLGGAAPPRTTALSRQEEADLRPLVRPLAAFVQLCRSVVASSDALGSWMPPSAAGRPLTMVPPPLTAPGYAALPPAARAIVCAMNLPPPAAALVAGVRSDDGGLNEWVVRGVLSAAMGMGGLYGSVPNPPFAKLTYLNLSGTGLSSLMTSRSSVGDIAAGGQGGDSLLCACPALRHLDVSFNDITCIPQGALGACEYLRYLDASFNRIVRIDSGSLAGSGGSISSGPGRVLRTLLLRGNALPSWTALTEVYQRCGTLISLDVRDNPVTSLAQPLPLAAVAPYGCISDGTQRPHLALTLAPLTSAGDDDELHGSPAQAVAMGAAGQDSNEAGNVYRRLLLQAFPGLSSLDGVPVLQRERSGTGSGARYITQGMVFQHGTDVLGDPVQDSEGIEGTPPSAAGEGAAASPEVDLGTPEQLSPWLRLASLNVSRQQLQALAPGGPRVAPLDALARMESKLTGVRGGTAPDDSDEADAALPAVHFDLGTLGRLRRLRSLNASFNDIADLRPLAAVPSLEVLTLEGNAIASLQGLGSLTALTSLDLGQNQLRDGALRRAAPALAGLTALTQLSLEGNGLTDLAPLLALPALMELYLGNNRLTQLGAVATLKGLPRLIILDCSGNAVCSHSDYRLYTVFSLHKLKVLDGSGVDGRDLTAASERFAGCVTLQYLSERFGGEAALQGVSSLELQSSRVRKVDAFSPRHVQAVETVLLENNVATCKGLLPLRAWPSLRTLRVDRNKIATLSDIWETPPSRVEQHWLAEGLAPSQALPPPTWFAHLEILSLNYNGISDVATLHLNKLPCLTVLSLAGNEISRVAGFEDCPRLRELSLSKNRLRNLDAGGLANLAGLAHLHLSDNSLRSLTGIHLLSALHTLQVGGNRIPDSMEVGKLAALPYLRTLTLSGNPVSRKPSYRVEVAKKMDLLQVLDGTPVSQEEKAQAEAMYYAEQRAAGLLPPSPGGGVQGGHGDMDLNPPPGVVPPRAVMGAAVGMEAVRSRPTVVSVRVPMAAVPQRTFLRAGGGGGGGGGALDRVQGRRARGAGGRR